MTIETATYSSQLNASYPAAGDPKSEGDDHIRLTKSAIKATWPNLTAAAVTASTVELNYVTGVTSSIQTQINTKAPAASPTFTGTVTLPSGTSIGTVTAAEIAYLSGVTSGIQAQINAKAPTASPALTGTPTAPTATAGTGTTQIATCAFVVATALSPVLPGQTGNDGKFLSTDGTNASWQATLGDVMTVNGTDLVGYRNIPQNSKSAAYTLVMNDAGKHILHPSSDTTARIFTIPANASVAYPIGTALTFVNQASGGVVTIAITSDTMRLAGAGTTGSRTLAANGVATAIKLTATEWIISGTGLT